MFALFDETELKRYGSFLGLVLGAALITTCIYWAIFGFGTWTRQVQSASNLMAAAAVAPVLQQPCVTATQSSAGQFVCPQHGAVGLPNWSAAGVPNCPICGQVMGFRGAGANTNNLTLAAMAGG